MTVGPLTGAGVLTRWPAPWRAVALLTGVLPVRGALRGRPPYQYRLHSGPGLLTLLMAVLVTGFSGSWLSLRAVNAYGLQSPILGMLFKLAINVSMIVSVWVVVVRGGRVPDLLSRSDELLTSQDQKMTSLARQGRWTTYGSWLLQLILVMPVVTSVTLQAWNVSEGGGETLSPDVNHLPRLVTNVMDVVIVVRAQALLSLNLHLMTALTEEFDGVSAELERLLRQALLRSCSDALTPAVPSRWAAGRDSVPGSPPAASVSYLSGTAGHPPEQISPPSADFPPPPQPSGSLADSLSSLRVRYLVVADVTAAYSGVYALPTVCDLLHSVTLLMSWLVVPSPPPQIVALMSCQAVHATVFSALLCRHGQRLEEAGRRQARLLLRSPPSAQDAQAEAGRLVALVEELRPVVGAPGVYSFNSQLMVTAVVGFVTYLVVLLQMT